MLTNIFLFISSWYLYHCIEYCYHLLGHSRKYGGYIYTLHMNHHKIQYPIIKLMDIVPYKTGNKYYFSDGEVAYIPPSILITCCLYKLLNFYNFIFIISEMILLATISDYIHKQIHIQDSWLEKYDWFLESRRLHLNHHKRININYSFAGLDYSMDKLAGTYNNN